MATTTALKRPSLIASFSDRPKTSDGYSKPLVRMKKPSFARNVSFNTPSPNVDNEAYLSTEQVTWKKEQCQRVNRHLQNVNPDIAPTVPAATKSDVTPFVAYDDSFQSLLGPSPSIKLLLRDTRAPYFYSGGAWIPRLSVLFVTSSLLRDNDPSAASSAGKRTEISKIEVYSSQDFSRDKVRCQDHSYLAAGCAPYPIADVPGFVLCVQGTLREPAGLVYVDARRPHKSHALLNNFQGRPFNSPCDIVANFYDGCLYFTDPAYGHERGYRPKPELPTGHIYRFDPSTGDCRVVANGISRPGGLAFSPDFGILYVSDLADKYGGTSIHAFDMTYNRAPAVSVGPLALSISTTTLRPDTPNGHQKNNSGSSTSSSVDSNHKEPPSASPHALAAANRLASPNSSVHINGMPNLSRSNSRERARKVMDIAQSSSKQLRSMSSNLGMNLKSSFNTTPHLPHTFSSNSVTSHLNHQPVQPPTSAYSPTPYHSSSAASVPTIASTHNNNTSNNYNNPTSNATTNPIRLASFLTNKRFFAYSPSNASSGGISTDPIQGNIWLGTDDGVEIFSGVMGSLVGKVLTPEDDDSQSAALPSPAVRGNGNANGSGSGDGVKMKGVGRVAFAGNGEAFLLGGERVWRVEFKGSVV